MKWMMGAVLALGLGGCSWQDDVKVSGAGALVEQQHPLGREVTRVLAGVPANIHLVAGAASGIHIRGQGNLLPYLELTEKGDKLEIEVKEGYRLEPPEPIDITITLPKVEELALAGLARGDLSGFSGDELVLSVAGLGDIVASQLALDRLEGNIAGAGSIIENCGAILVGIFERKSFFGKIISCRKFGIVRRHEHHICSSVFIALCQIDAFFCINLKYFRLIHAGIYAKNQWRVEMRILSIDISSE